MTTEIIVKATGEKKVAVYAANSGGNMKYSVDGKFYTDKQFNKLFELTGNKYMYWRSNIPQLFEEILNNPGTSILSMPLTITKSILGELAEYSNELQDEKLIAICGRLGLYDASIPTHPEHEKLEKIISKFY